MGASNIAELLEHKFKERKRKNGAYSLRAFARDLGVKPGPLSEMMTGRRSVTPATASILSRRLDLPATEAKQMLSMAADGRFKKEKATASGVNFAPVPEEHFAVIADWEHFAILSLIKTDDFQSDPAWIAARLGIPKRTATAALNRLVKLGYLKKRDAAFIRTEPRYHTTSDIPSAALREASRQNITQALESIESVPVELRDITTMTVALDPANLKQAKKLIYEFRSRFLELIEKGPKKEVYNLNIQLCPVTKTRSK